MASSDLLFLLPTQKYTVLSAEKGDAASTSCRGIYLDINEEYTAHAIERAFAHPTRAPHFRIVRGIGCGAEPVKLPPSCDFQWAEYERIDWEDVLGGMHGASSYCIRKGLSRKAQLAFYTSRYLRKNPDSILKQAIPYTIIIDTWPVWEINGKGLHYGGFDDVVIGSSGSTASNLINRKAVLEDCLKEARNAIEDAENKFQGSAGNSDADAPVWILKGSTVNKGDGIYIVHLYEQIVDICWSESAIREWVLQRYISTPLLLRRRKFHIRAYILAVSALRVYLFQKCLTLCSGRRYRRQTTSDLFSHITNTAYQDRDPNFREADCVLLWGEEDILPILLKDGTCQDAGEARHRIKHVLDRMGSVIAETFKAYETEFSVFSPIEGCFEHFGLDFLVDSDWQVYLLEVNPGPDFKQTGRRLQTVIDQLMAATIDVALLNKPCDDFKLVYCIQKNAKGEMSKRINIKVT